MRTQRHTYMHTDTPRTDTRRRTHTCSSLLLCFSLLIVSAPFCFLLLQAIRSNQDQLKQLTQTHRHKGTQTHRHKHRHTHRQTHTGTGIDTHTDIHTHTHADIHKHTLTHRHTYTQTHTDRQTQTQTTALCCFLLLFYSFSLFAALCLSLGNHKQVHAATAFKSNERQPQAIRSNCNQPQPHRHRHRDTQT